MSKYKDIAKPVNSEDLQRMWHINSLLAANVDLTQDQKRFWNKNIYFIKFYYKDINNYWNSISSKPLKITQ